MDSQPPSLVAPHAARTRDGARPTLMGALAAGAVGAVCLFGGATVPVALAAAGIAGVSTAVAARRPRASVAEAGGGAVVEDAGPPIFLTALEALPDPLLLVAGGEPDDLAGRRILFANAAARAFLRIPAEGGLLVTAVRRPEVLEAVDESLFGGIAAAVAFETGGAQDRFWRVWAVPLEASGDGRRLALVLMRDETDARRNERMRADFLANASHELRTPLASLSGFIETLRGHARDDPAARDRFLHIMAEQADRMRRLIDDLLSLSRIELNEHIPPSDTCDLAGAAADVADALAPLAREKGVEVKTDMPLPGRAEIIGDYDQIVQVVQNLLANAVKYAPAGSRVGMSVQPGLSLDEAQAGDPASPRRAAEGAGRLPLLTADRSEHAVYAVLKVTDAGPGMRREHLPRLSERFYRVEGQKSGERSGTGLGLAIVKHILNRHRGGIVVESAPGLGAEFTAYFPMAPRREAPAEPAGARALVDATKLS
jgi:two-component system phosphate regulon sensor histidine kinase PhoR